MTGASPVDWIVYSVLRGVIGLLGLLPRAAGSAVGAWIGRLGNWPLGIRRSVVRRQIAAAFPDYDKARVRQIAKGSYAQLGRSMVEAALTQRSGREAVLAMFDGAPGFHHIEEGIRRGQGVALITGHLGNWELGGAYVAARGVPIDVIARRQANPLFQRYLTRTRERLGMGVIHDIDAVRRTPRAFREGRAVAFVADQGALGMASTYVPFFGRPAKTPRGAAVFALRCDVPMVFVAVTREPSGKYRLNCEPLAIVATGDRERDVDTMVAAYTQVLEGWVRRYPEQYFWQHRRWKHQLPDTPPDLREP